MLTLNPGASLLVRVGPNTEMFHRDKDLLIPVWVGEGLPSSDEFSRLPEDNRYSIGSCDDPDIVLKRTHISGKCFLIVDRDMERRRRRLGKDYGVAEYRSARFTSAYELMLDLYREVSERPELEPELEPEQPSPFSLRSFFR